MQSSNHNARVPYSTHTAGGILRSREIPEKRQICLAICANELRPLLFSLALSRKGCPNCLLENVRPIRKIRGRFAYQPLPNRALVAKYLLPMSGKLASLGVAVPRIMAPRL
jgi:hypothetical protein